LEAEILAGFSVLSHCYAEEALVDVVEVGVPQTLDVSSLLCVH
jgi:hypothetical protein